ncbi:maleylpyruvate isomerase N-terminal domain-containing protein [Micromonospora sp. DT53]|uniref:maleylpyruvate isomerase N-terminal domain-containing protein n=1 Tax=Micromonospora sp. DT53 TaxID=3393444 RepID=UPI003CF0F490
MAVNRSDDGWGGVRESLDATADRFGDLVRAAQHPAALATARWSIVDTAAHVVAIAAMYTSIVRPGAAPSALSVPAIGHQLQATTMDNVSDLNDVVMRHFTERDPEMLTQRLRAEVDQILGATENVDPATPVPWLGGSRPPVAAVLAHLLNELLIHGWDIARVARLPWSIPPRDAALYFDLFLVGLLTSDQGRLLDSAEPVRAGRIAVEFRSAYTSTRTLVLRDGRVSVDEPGRDVDVRVSFDPPTLNLMMFGRISRSRAILTRKIAIGGRRPWLLPRFLRTVRAPA